MLFIFISYLYFVASENGRKPDAIVSRKWKSREQFNFTECDSSYVSKLERVSSSLFLIKQLIEYGTVLINQYCLSEDKTNLLLRGREEK